MFCSLPYKMPLSIPGQEHFRNTLIEVTRGNGHPHGVLQGKNGSCATPRQELLTHVKLVGPQHRCKCGNSWGSSYDLPLSDFGKII